MMTSCISVHAFICLLSRGSLHHLLKDGVGVIRGRVALACVYFEVHGSSEHTIYKIYIYVNLLEADELCIHQLLRQFEWI